MDRTMPTPHGHISGSEIWQSPIAEPIVDTKGYPVELIEKVSELIMQGGYSNIQAIEIIDLVTNWGKE